MQGQRVASYESEQRNVLTELRKGRQRGEGLRRLGSERHKPARHPPVALMLSKGMSSVLLSRRGG